MEVINQLRSSFRSRMGASVTSRKNSSGHCEPSSTESIDSNNNDSMHKKRARNVCDLCGKRLLKLVGWRNYFTLPCKCRHVFCKQCITERLQCRQKVLRSVSFDLMWTFPCPGSSQCGQELTVDFSKGSSYSKNLVARDLGSGDESWELEEEEDMSEELEFAEVRDRSNDSDCSHDASLREIG